MLEQHSDLTCVHLHTLVTKAFENRANAKPGRRLTPKSLISAPDSTCLLRKASTTPAGLESCLLRRGLLHADLATVPIPSKFVLQA